MTRPAPFALALLLGLAAHAPLHAQQAVTAPPASAPPALAPPGGLHPPSSAAATADPLVQRCHALALERDRDSNATKLEQAANMFEFAAVFDAASVCRQALSKYRDDRSLIIAEANASWYLTILAFGADLPRSDSLALLAALRLSADDAAGMEGPRGQILGFYLGSAFEYGIGTRPNRNEALKWYAIAAAAGDPISRREADRLQAGTP